MKPGLPWIVDRMKWLTPHSTWWHTLPHRVNRGQRRTQRGAGHGPYWHRRAQEGKPALHPERGRRAARAARAHHPARFADVLGDRPRARILLEASTESEWVARCLERLGHEVIVADPNFAPMYATRTRKIKTDRRDARALAEACRLGAYRPAHRLSDAQRYVRGRLTVRDALVRTRTQYISVIRALLRQHGWRVPTGGLLDLGDDRPRQGVGQRIHLVRPVQRDRADATLVVDTDDVGHGSSCLRDGRIWCVHGPTRRSGAANRLSLTVPRNSQRSIG
jgi:hypothetical protein